MRLPRRRSTWLALLGAAVLLGPPLSMAATLIALRLIGKSRLAKAEAELDAADPGWRWEELAAARPGAADAGDARAVLAESFAAGRRPGSYAGTAGGLIEHYLDQTHEAEANLLLPDEVAAALEWHLAANAEAIRLARSAVSLTPRPLTLPEDPTAAVAGLELQNIREGTRLLTLEAAWAGHTGDFTLQWDAVSAAAGLTRHAQGEPLLIGALVEVALTAAAVHAVERAVAADPRPDERHLTESARFLEEARSRPTLTEAFRTERAWQHSYLGRLADGTNLLTKSELADLGLQNLDFVPGFALRPLVPRLQAEHLRQSTGALDAARKDPWSWRDGVTRGAGAARLVMNNYPGVAEAVARTYGLLEAARAGLSCERFRLRHARWPESLDELAGEFPGEVAPDPFTGGPLRYARREDGVAVYSVGPDLKDSGGRGRRDGGDDPGDDVAFRLYDEAARRQPASPVRMPEGVPSPWGDLLPSGEEAP